MSGSEVKTPTAKAGGVSSAGREPVRGRAVTGVAARLCGVAVLAGCSLPTGGAVQAEQSPGGASPSPSASYTPGDAAALVAAATVALAAPDGVGDPDAVVRFVEGVQAAVKDPSNPGVDTGYANAVIVEADISGRGSADPVCVAVRSPSLSGLVPGQQTWVAYVSPPIQGDGARLFFTDAGVGSCAQAREEVAGFQSDLGARQESNVRSQQFLQSAFLALPISDLTPGGVELFDVLRGEQGQQSAVPRAAASSAAPAPPVPVPGGPVSVPPDFEWPTAPSGAPPAAPLPAPPAVQPSG